MGGNDNCCVADCRSTRHNSNISFHRIPKKPESIRKLWIKATGRVLHGRNKFTPTNNSLFCGRHFVNGKRSDDPTSVDFIPTTNHPVTLPVTLRQRKATVSSMKSSKYDGAVETLVKENCSVFYTKKRVLLPEIDLRNVQNEVQISHERSDEMTECEMLHCQNSCEVLGRRSVGVASRFIAWNTTEKGIANNQSTNPLPDSIIFRVVEILRSSTNCDVYQEPFYHCVIQNFMEGRQLIDGLQEELSELEYSRKDNDLYKFHQSTDDLKTADSPLIKSFRHAMCTIFREWLTEVCGIQLNDNVSMFSAKYLHTDTLLCHDDELEDRRIAFIYYLVSPSWNKEDGGSLDLFAVDGNIQPTEIVKSIIPQRNSLVFFEVSPGSYHQVAEVLSEDKVRWSIGGWFHGPSIDRPPAYREPVQPRQAYGSIDEDVFFEWINPVYLTPHTQGSIQEQFEANSEIELQDFLQAEKFKTLLEELKSLDIKWKRRGPPNKRCYYSVEQSDSQASLKECLELFESDAMFLLLSNLTGLKLHELAGSSSEGSETESDNVQGTSQTGSTLNCGASDSNSKKNQENSSSKNDSSVRSNVGSSNGLKGISEPVESEQCTAKCHIEVQSWKHGCYTLAHDTDTEGSEFTLDLMYYAGCHDWQEDYGGFTTYIAKEEDEELLTVTPKENSLALVYRDKDSQRFVKHLNSNVKKMENKGFYEISAVYFER